MPDGTFNGETLYHVDSVSHFMFITLSSPLPGEKAESQRVHSCPRSQVTVEPRLQLRLLDPEPQCYNRLEGSIFKFF